MIHTDAITIILGQAHQPKAVLIHVVIVFFCVLTAGVTTELLASVWHVYGWYFHLIMFFLWVTFVTNCSVGVNDWTCSTADSGPEYSQTNEMQPCSFCSVVFGSRPLHVELNFCFSTEIQQPACLGPIKSATLVSLLILKSDVKTNKWQRFMSEVNWQPFSIPPGLSVPGVYEDAALRWTMSGNMGDKWPNSVLDWLKPFSVIHKALSITVPPLPLWGNMERMFWVKNSSLSVQQAIIILVATLYDCAL